MSKVKVMYHYDGVEVFNICDLMDVLNPTLEMDYVESNKAVEKWCEDNDALYYGKPKASFFVDEAVKKAKENNKSKVLVEDLS